MNSKAILEIWADLKTSKIDKKVRKVGDGLIMIFDPVTQTTKIAILVESSWDNSLFPKWSGISFSMDVFSLPVEKDYLVLELVDSGQSEIFVFVCMDLIENMGDCKGHIRDARIQETISQWNNFFKENKEKLMPVKVQQGLFAELKFLYRLLKSKLISNSNAISSWKGAERAYHDFQYENRVIEVKSTTGKEPKMVRISNEKQLNDINIKKLLLLATSLTNVNGAETLEDLVISINRIILNEEMIKDSFDMKLLKYGLKMEDIKKYTTGYIVEKEQSFTISDGFPRIINAPNGLAEIKYSVLINSCSEFEFDNEKLIGAFIHD